MSNDVLLCEGMHRGDRVWESRIPRREEGGGLGREGCIPDLASNSIIPVPETPFVEWRGEPRGRVSSLVCSGIDPRPWLLQGYILALPSPNCA